MTIADNCWERGVAYLPRLCIDEDKVAWGLEMYLH